MSLPGLSSFRIEKLRMTKSVPNSIPGCHKPLLGACSRRFEADPNLIKQTLEGRHELFKKKSAGQI
jgi:hypothetical protein